MFNITRRAFVAGTLGTSLLSRGISFGANRPEKRFRIGACDWSLGALSQVRALEVAREIGLDGVQVNFRTAEKGEDLRLPEVRKRYLDKSAELGVDICSLAIVGLNQVPLATSDQAEEWVRECIEVMPSLGQKVVLLAFFGKGDIRDKPELQDRVIERLRRLAPLAEKAGVVLGIESTLNAAGHLRIVRAVDSPAIKVYYDMRNMLDQGYDPYEDMRQLEGELICEIHCKESGTLIGKGDLDFRRIKGILDDFGWKGWLVLEGAVDPKLGLVESYKRNAEFLRKVFGEEA